jgi:hypothetical protein
MANIHSIKENKTPSNPAMAEAFLQAASKASPEIGGDTLQAESLNMTQRSENTTGHYAKVMADMSTQKGSKAMHETNGDDAQMFAEVKEMAEPVFTGSHNQLKRNVISAVAAMAGTALAYGVMTGDKSRTVNAVAISGAASLFTMGYKKVKKVMGKQSQLDKELDETPVTLKETAANVGINVIGTAAICAVWIGLTKKMTAVENNTAE